MTKNYKHLQTMTSVFMNLGQKPRKYCKHHFFLLYSIKESGTE